MVRHKIQLGKQVMVLLSYHVAQLFVWYKDKGKIQNALHMEDYCKVICFLLKNLLLIFLL